MTCADLVSLSARHGRAPSVPSEAERGADAAPAASHAEAALFHIRPDSATDQIKTKIRAFRRPLPGKPTVLHTGHHNTAACNYSNLSADLGTYQA